MREDEKPNLMEQGTRYDHYVELRECFASGIEVISGLEARGYDSEADRLLKPKLVGAVAVINKRLNYLSEFDKKTEWSSELATTLRAIDNQRDKRTIDDQRAADNQRRIDAAEKAAKEDVNQIRPQEDSGESSNIT